jgi:uncharacterized protein YjbJ (UPF0337 family)
VGDRMQRLKGKTNQIAGKARASVGSRSGDRSEQVKGAGQVAKGKTQEAAGKASSEVKKATR